MGKYLTLVLVIPLLFGCAARKAAVSKTQTQTHVDSTVVEHRDSVAIQQNAIIVKENTDEIEVTPLDTSKPVIIGSTRYFNAKVKVRKTQKQVVDSTKTTVVKSVDKQASVTKDVKTKTFEKKVDKKTNYMFYLWLIILLVALWLIWRFRIK